MKTLGYVLAAALALVMVALGAVALWISVELRGSLPVLEGALRAEREASRQLRHSPQPVRRSH